MADKVIFYISGQTAPNRGTDIETRFSGLHYLKCKGLEDKGKVKNKYQESFADTQSLLVYEPTGDVYLEPTDVTLTLLFVGPNRMQVYNDFYNYVKKGKFYYYDTYRKMEAYITLIEAVKPSDVKFIGSTPYVQADFKFKNLWGESFSRTN